MTSPNTNYHHFSKRLGGYNYSHIICNICLAKS